MSSDSRASGSKPSDGKTLQSRQNSANNEQSSAVEAKDFNAKQNCGPQNIQDMSNWFPAILEQIQSRFQTMSDQILNRIDEMGQRIDDLEQSLNDIMVHANIPDDQAQSQARINSVTDKVNPSVDATDRH